MTPTSPITGPRLDSDSDLVPPLGKASSAASNPCTFFFLTFVSVCWLLRPNRNNDLLSSFSIPSARAIMLYCLFYSNGSCGRRVCRYRFFLLMAAGAAVWLERLGEERAKAVRCLSAVLAVYAVAHVLFTSDLVYAGFLFRVRECWQRAHH